jgi:hypothetical protein
VVVGDLGELQAATRQQRAKGSAASQEMTARPL